MSLKNVPDPVYPQDKYFSYLGTQGEKGSGIGLQLCFEFIKMNKGDYRIISEKGNGTSFIFTCLAKKSKLGQNNKTSQTNKILYQIRIFICSEFQLTPSLTILYHNFLYPLSQTLFENQPLCIYE